MSRSAMAEKMLFSCGIARVDGTKAGYLSSLIFRSAMADSPLRSSGPDTRYTARLSMPSSVTSRSSTSADIVSSTSSRTAGSNRRRTSNKREFPMAQMEPEKVMTQPLELKMDEKYEYKLAGTEQVNGVFCYEIGRASCRERV